MAIWNLNNSVHFRARQMDQYLAPGTHYNMTHVRIMADTHSKAIRNAVWSNNETEIVSVSFDQSAALTSVETGKKPSFEVHVFLHSVEAQLNIALTVSCIQLIFSF